MSRTKAQNIEVAKQGKPVPFPIAGDNFITVGRLEDCKELLREFLRHYADQEKP